MDAAIATNAALGLMEPHMCGMGGDLFAIVWDAKDRQLHGLNASGRSPKSLDHGKLSGRLQKLGTRHIPYNSILSVSVPGAVHGWTTLHDRFGKLPFPELLAPAVHYAESGFPVSPIIAVQWQGAAAEIPNTLPGVFHSVYTPGGQAPSTGEIFINRDLARSYRLVADAGNKAFYQGELAERIVDFMKNNDGYIDHVDLQAHRSDWITPVAVKYRGYDVFELPPSGQGIAALQMLKMLEDDNHCRHGIYERGLPAPDAGGQKTGVRRPGEILRRSGFQRSANRTPAQQEIQQKKTFPDKRQRRCQCQGRREDFARW